MLDIEHEGERSESYHHLSVSSAPGVFVLARTTTGTPLSFVLNEDGTVNLPTNRAKRGSIVTLYGTGEGETDPPGVDGQIAGSVLPKPKLPVKVRVGVTEAEVQYAGAAPGMVAGTLQVNFRLPPDLRGPVDFRLVIGNNHTGDMRVWIED